MVSRKTVLKMLSMLPLGGVLAGIAGSGAAAPGGTGVGATGGKGSGAPGTGIRVRGKQNLLSSIGQPQGRRRERKRFPIINAAEHVWVTNDPRFPILLENSSCGSVPNSDYSGEFVISEMDLRGINKTVISHVCYYGKINDYTIHCVKTWPDRFAGFGLLVGHRLYKPNDPENVNRFRKLILEDGLIGLRLSPIYDRNRVWLNDPACYPLWMAAQELEASFNIFLAPEQIPQVADMAERFPGVDIVIDHMAMIDISRPDSEGIDPLCNLSRFSNVYVRTSMHNVSKEHTPYRDVWPYLRKLYDAYGPQRMVFANFFEYLINKEMIPFFTAEDKEWILGGTAEKIYFKKRT